MNTPVSRSELPHEAISTIDQNFTQATPGSGNGNVRAVYVDHAN